MPLIQFYTIIIILSVNLTVEAVIYEINRLPRKIATIDIDDKNQPNLIQDGVGEKTREMDEKTKSMIDELLTARLRYGSIDTPFVKLNNGVEMPVIALGTALIGPPLAKYIVEAAIDLGYRAIDTAFIYGNEKVVGEAIKTKIDDGTVKREDLFIMSKLWSTFHRPDLVEVAYNNSLQALGVDYIDLLMLHNPMSFKEGNEPIPKINNEIQYSEYNFIDAWLAMENLIKNGKVKSIGVSNFNAEQIDKILLKGTVKPVVNQVECHPYLSQRRLSAHCASRAVKMSCYSTLGSKGTPKEYKALGSTPVIDDPVVKSLARDLGVSPAKVLIRYQLERGHAVVVKSSSASHLKDNIEAFNMKLSKREVEILDGLNRNQRSFNFVGMGETHKEYPFKNPY